MEIHEFTKRLMSRENLSESEAERALELMLSAGTPDAAIASFLTALAIKGETPEEITGFARVMRKHAVSIRSDHLQVVDTAGTGGGAETFNISTTAAFVIAGAGLPVAKHGNRAVTSKCGSADVLTALGVKIDGPPEVAERCLNEIGIAFMFAPLFHPAMKRVAQIRRELGHRTIFNMLGPLTNPAGAGYQLVGVYAPELTEKLGNALAALGCKKAWVVHSFEGLDEIGGRTKICEVASGSVRTFAANFTNFTNIKGGTVEENAAITKGILEGKILGPAREVVVLNAAAALHVAADADFDQAIKKAEESLNSGAALEKLNQLIRMTNESDK